MQWEAMTDEELIDVIRRGPGSEEAREATNELLERYKEVVRSKARAYFLIGADRDDVIQEGMIGLYKAIVDFQPQKMTKFRSFAQLCIQRQIVSAIRLSSRLKHWPLNSYISLDRSVNDEDGKEMSLMELLPDAAGRSPEEVLMDEDNLHQLENAIIDALSPMEKRVLQLFLKGLDYMEIAKAMDKKPKAIDNALQRIKRKIMKLTSD